MTRTGATLGALAYMAPEQLRGADVDRRSDVYALGVTLYEMLTLRSPFLAEAGEAADPRGPAGAAEHPQRSCSA